MADDHAAHAISAYSSRINQTPQIDRIARDGMRFDRCFCVNSICTPSRACIITGKYSHKNGVPVFNFFDGSQPTVAKYLQAAGYYTGMIGKWHLGSEPTGFDYWSILPGQGVYYNPTFYDAAGRHDIQGYATDIITDMALAFLKNRPADKPFFLMCHHKAPHRPWNPDDKHFALYDGEKIPEPATLRDDYATRTDAAREATMTVGKDLKPWDLKVPPPGLSGDALLKWKYQRFIKDYLRCVASIDDNVGRLLDYLDKTGLSKNTVVIYTSDQGFFLGDHGWFDKRFMYEQSIRMPFLVRWPGVTKPGSAQEAMALNVDFAPTFLEIAGLPTPKDMQGRSLVPLLARRAPGRLAHKLVLPLLPRPGRPQHTGPLRGPNRDAQADLFLEEEPVGMLRLGARSRRVAQPGLRSGPRRPGGEAQAGNVSAEEGSAGQRRIRRQAADHQFGRSAAKNRPAGTEPESPKTHFVV